MTTISLHNHEAVALSQRRLGVIIRPFIKQPACVYDWEAPRKQKEGDLFIGPDILPTGKTRNLVFGVALGRGSTRCLGEREFCKLFSPFGPPGTVIGCREAIVRSEDGWWGQYEADGAWVTSQLPAVPTRICWWSRKDRSLAPSQKTEKLSAEQCPNFAIRYHVIVGEVRCKQRKHITKEEWAAWCPPDSLNPAWPVVAEYHPAESGEICLSEHCLEEVADETWVWLCEIKPQS